MQYMFGGELRCLNVEVSEEMKDRILKEFDTARIDSRGAITDVPVAFLRELFNQVVEKKDVGAAALQPVRLQTLGHARGGQLLPVVIVRQFDAFISHLADLAENAFRVFAEQLPETPCLHRHRHALLRLPGSLFSRLFA